ncbi:periplasmic binding protein-like II [Basidiobolus meristosporus CBS 931.73]|uniref:Periplasmic binding protein-like II n=1 Tax=Basidiobolus meristosporus CBS 931.73 TaxID=1314790 RepID=A0A1Y1Y6P6_9FUNG|nr:periplasmic binding protein-like II [Basidiobolus meristosporus CBS 931.73]|eukprot:ORX93658.1 periplasmic binding protein-like II [Basidiobolus meristosporus CBS 931.73]
MANPAYTLRVGCVPEHFSCPLHIAQKDGYFKRRNVQVELVSVPEGTGKMLAMLKDGSLDIAMMVAEGVTAGISNGADQVKIIGTYVESPLCWAISAGINSKHTSEDTLKDGTIGISRNGSGSHVMSLYLADTKGWLKSDQPVPLSFEILNNIDGLIAGVNDGRADAFLWEVFTTKPYYDAGKVKKIGQVVPPWPSFYIGANVDTLKSHQPRVKQFLEAVNEATRWFVEHKETESVEFVKKQLGYPEEDVRNWFKTVSYPEDVATVSKSILMGCSETLKKASAINATKPVEELCDTNIVHFSD